MRKVEQDDEDATWQNKAKLVTGAHRGQCAKAYEQVTAIIWTAMPTAACARLLLRGGIFTFASVSCFGFWTASTRWKEVGAP